MKRHACPRQSGLTLIEVIVAIAIFAVLGVISYRAVSSMSDSRVRVDAELARWRAISRVMQLVDNDLTQLAPRPTSLGAVQSEAPLLLQKEGERDELRLVRLDGANGGLQRRAYRVNDGALILVRWSAREDSATQDVLLDRVKSLHWRIVNNNGQESDTWPPTGATGPDMVPPGVRMDLELEDAGLIKRVFSIR